MSAAFSLTLNKYIDGIGCTARELAELSGLSAATISRYRSGDRVPEAGSRQLEAVIDALAELAGDRLADDPKGKARHRAENKAAGQTDKDTIRREFYAVCDGKEAGVKGGSSGKAGQGFDAESFRFNFSLMLEKLSISMNDMAGALGYDTSYLSRISSGKRTPADPERFISEAAHYVLMIRDGREYISRLADLLGCRASDIRNNQEAYDRLYGFLYSDSESPRRYAERLLSIMNAFDLEAYIRENKDAGGLNDNSKDDTSGFIPEVTYGLANAPALIQEFIRRTTASDRTGALTICWNFSEMEKGSRGAVDFRLTEMVARMAESGLAVRLIHCGTDSAEDMISWMSHWMPLYLTGRIEPYYLEGGSGQVFHSAFLLSGREVLQIEGVENHAERGRIVFSKEKDDVIYYSRRAEDLISLSEKALEVIGVNDSGRRFDFLTEDAAKPGKRKTLLSTPPTYTASKELLETLFARNKIKKSDRNRILDYAEDERKRIMRIMEHSEQEDHIPYITREEYAENPIHLSLSGLFYERDIFYTYEEYMCHVEDTRRFMDENKNYHVVLRQGMSFRNIQIFMHSGEWVMISKNKTPAAHFIIKHPALIDSLEKMIEIYTRRG